MTGEPALWRTEVVVPESALAAIEAALEPGALALSSFEEPAVRCGPALCWRVQALTATLPDRAAVVGRLAAAAAAAGVAAPELLIAPLDAAEWRAKIHGAAAPLQIGRFRLVGTDVRPHSGRSRATLVLDAGLAFGTGRHETTQGCLLALDRLARSGRFRRALDLGTGSGILAMAVARLWRAPVLAADVDAVAVTVARVNIRRNRLHRLIRVVVSDALHRPLVRRRAPYDLIVANIAAPQLADLARDLARALDPGGAIILSGFLAPEAASVLAAYRLHGLYVSSRIELGYWPTLVLTRCRPCRARRRIRPPGRGCHSPVRAPVRAPVRTDPH